MDFEGMKNGAEYLWKLNTLARLFESNPSDETLDEISRLKYEWKLQRELSRFANEIGLARLSQSEMLDAAKELNLQNLSTLNKIFYRDGQYRNIHIDNDHRGVPDFAYIPVRFPGLFRPLTIGLAFFSPDNAVNENGVVSINTTLHANYPGQKNDYNRVFDPHDKSGEFLESIAPDEFMDAPNFTHDYSTIRQFERAQLRVFTAGALDLRETLDVVGSLRVVSNDR